MGVKAVHGASPAAGSAQASERRPAPPCAALPPAAGGGWRGWGGVEGMDRRCITYLVRWGVRAAGWAAGAQEPSVPGAVGQAGGRRGFPMSRLARQAGGGGRGSLPGRCWAKARTDACPCGSTAPACDRRPPQRPTVNTNGASREARRTAWDALPAVAAGRHRVADRWRAEATAPRHTSSSSRAGSGRWGGVTVGSGRWGGCSPQRWLTNQVQCCRTCLRRPCAAPALAEAPHAPSPLLPASHPAGRGPGLPARSEGRLRRPGRARWRLQGRRPRPGRRVPRGRQPPRGAPHPCPAPLRRTARAGRRRGAARAEAAGPGAQTARRGRHGAAAGCRVGPGAATAASGTRGLEEGRPADHRWQWCSRACGTSQGHHRRRPGVMGRAAAAAGQAGAAAEAWRGRRSSSSASRPSSSGGGGAAAAAAAAAAAGAHAASTADAAVGTIGCTARCCAGSSSACATTSRCQGALTNSCRACWCCTPGRFACRGCNRAAAICGGGQACAGSPQAVLGKAAAGAAGASCTGRGRCSRR